VQIIILSLFFILLTQSLTFANPACAVCTIAIGASLELARYLGVSDNIVGLWSGALLSLIGYWTILWFDKKNWKFRGRDTLLMLLSLSMIAFVYIKEIQYYPKIFGFLDSFLFSTIIGFVIFILSQVFYQWIKAKNGGHAHFPFEKVVLPLVLLLSLSLLFNKIVF
jgi:hypothetical protein